MIPYTENFGTRLPDLTMCGGDTTPWLIKLIQENGNPYPIELFSDCNATLSFAPYSNGTTFRSSKPSSAEVLLTGNFGRDADGGAIVTFEPLARDTIDLQGKYTYQISISQGKDSRVMQGIITIKQNING